MEIGFLTFWCLVSMLQCHSFFNSGTYLKWLRSPVYNIWSKGNHSHYRDGPTTLFHWSFTLRTYILNSVLVISVSWLFRRVVAGRDSDIIQMRVLSIMPHIPKNLVRSQMERSHFQSVSSDRNIPDYLWRWSTHFGQNILTKIRLSIFHKTVHFPSSLFTCVRNSEKE